MDYQPRIKRPPSYSDSFLFLPHEPLEPLTPLRHVGIQEEVIDSITTETNIIPISRTLTPAETWFNRLLGFAFHITLIGMFETIFFFQYVSVSENTGLQKMVDNYVGGVLTTCGNWTGNTSLFVNDVLSVIINTTVVKEEYDVALHMRLSANAVLQLQAWLYVAGLGAGVIIAAVLGHRASLRLAWKRILLENAIMVALLGIYEFVFFRTIIYNYDNLSLPELNQFVVTQLQQECGLLGA
jgi:hypothetical protein